MTTLPLEGVRILDFTRVLAGPLCTMLLADLGADVIKIEHPKRGDDTRQWGPPWAGDGTDAQSAYFLSVNRNKRSLTLNLKTEDGRALARELARHSHVVIENFKIGQMAHFGLDYVNLQPMNPRLVYCSITGFGQTGPYSQRPGYDYVVQAMSGLMSITGPADGEPYKVGVAISDVIAGLYAANAIQAALRHSETTGQGQYIDVSLLDTQLAALVNVASNYLISGQTPPRLGNQHPNIVPYQVFDASDGQFVVAVGNDGQYAALCTLLKRPDLFHDVRFATNPARVQNREILIPLLQAEFKRHPVGYWIERLVQAGIPCGPINTVAEALQDPHAQARGLIQQTHLKNGALVSLLGMPVHLSRTPAEIRYPPPALGEHTEQILQEVLQLTASDIEKYRTNGAI